MFPAGRLGCPRAAGSLLAWPCRSLLDTDGAGAGSRRKLSARGASSRVSTAAPNLAKLKQCRGPREVGVFSPHRDAPATIEPPPGRQAGPSGTNSFQLGISAAEMGTWVLGAPLGARTLDPAMYLLFGVEAVRFTTTFENLMRAIHPRTSPMVEATVAPATLRPDALVCRVFASVGPRQRCACA